MFWFRGSFDVTAARWRICSQPISATSMLPLLTYFFNAHMSHVLSLHNTKMGAVLVKMILGQEFALLLIQFSDTQIYHVVIMSLYIPVRFETKLDIATKVSEFHCLVKMLQMEQESLSFPTICNESRLAMVTCSKRWRFLLNYSFQNF